VSKLWSERENQQDATVRCLSSTLSQHVSGIIMPIFRRTRRVLLRWFCWMWLVAVVGLAPYNAVPHNRYQPHPAEPAQHTTCSNTRLGLLRMGIMMRETCWECVDNKHLTVASCWFSLSLLNRNLFPFFICAIYSHNSPTISRPVLSCTRVTCTDICHVLDKIFPPVLGSCLSMVVAVSCSFENGKSW